MLKKENNGIEKILTKNQNKAIQNPLKKLEQERNAQNRF